ncbi:MAG: EamA family transporter [Actinomycetota bacterium]|nr:EamA family transporter [Actinomycetota bacterium]
MVEASVGAARASPPLRRPVLGYTMVAVAATLFAVNGTVAKVILASGISSLRLTEVRLTGAALGLLAALALVRPGSLRLRRAELSFFVLFGIGGVGLVQWFYFFAIHRLPIAIALLIQYLAPLIVALWARFVMHRRIRARIWAALVLALAGLSLVVQVWQRGALDPLGVAASLGAAVAFSLYILLAEHGVGGRDAVSLSCYGFVFGALFFAVVQPWWSFPGDIVGERVSLLGNLASAELPVWALMLSMVLLGTIAPFGLFVAALRHVPAPRLAVVAMLEPVVAALVAWAWLDESLAPVQLVGAATVLAGIFLAQTARDPEAAVPRGPAA